MNWPLSVQGFTVLKTVSPSSECKGFFFSSLFFSFFGPTTFISAVSFILIYIFSHKILNSTLHSFLSQIEMIVNSTFFPQQWLTFQALFKVLGSYTATTKSVKMMVFSISMCNSHSGVGYGQRFVCVSSFVTVHHKLWSSAHADNFLDFIVWSSLPSSPREVEPDPLISLYRYHRTETSSTTDNSFSHWRKSYINTRVLFRSLEYHQPILLAWASSCEGHQQVK